MSHASCAVLLPGIAFGLGPTSLLTSVFRVYKRVSLEQGFEYVSDGAMSETSVRRIFYV